MSSHVVMFSSGAGSWAAARRVADQHGTDALTLLFSDVSMEDEDNYRFLHQAAADIGGELVIVKDGRDIWQVFKDDSFLGNARLANCSKYLKQRPARAWLDANCDPATTTVYVGIDWSEQHRLPAVVRNYLPFRAEAPLCGPPYLDKAVILADLRARGIEPPRLYDLGFAHANCLHPDTRYITSDGVKTLRETLGKTVTVLGRGGGWHEAEIRSFGEQELYEIQLRRFTDEKTVLATADHLWPVRKQSGRTAASFKATTDLRVGESMASMFGMVRHNVRPSQLGIQAGFVFGDGAADIPTSGQITPARAFFCGDKDKALLPYFSGARTSTRSDGVVVAHDLPRYFKQPPPLNESQGYLYGWLAGYFAADGSFTAGNTQAVLSSASRANLLVARDVAARLGIATSPIRSYERLGYGTTPTPLYRIAFVLSTLRRDFFLIPEHAERFDAREGQLRMRPADWAVKSITATGRVEEVMCAVVPDGHIFTLEDNLLTHNCGGGCVRAGQGQFAHLLKVMPERFAWWEEQEQGLRDHLGKDVAILRDRRGGTSVPLTLRAFRERHEAAPEQTDLFDIGGCGCFVDAA